MSWFFSKKKHHRSSPSDTSEEETSSSNTAQQDDYIIIEKQENPLSPTMQTSGGLYPYLGDRPNGPPPLPSVMSEQQQFNSADSQNYIHGIPFKLSKTFDNDFEIDRIRVDEIMAFFVRIKNEDYDYDFALERSVINEMESGAE